MDTFEDSTKAFFWAFGFYTQKDAIHKFYIEYLPEFRLP